MEHPRSLSPDISSPRWHQLPEDTELEVSEDTSLLGISIHSGSSQSRGAEVMAESKTLPAAVIPEAKVFKRSHGKTFESGSLESFYKPIDSYEGRHRYDPSFEWEPQEERRVVRKVITSTRQLPNKPPDVSVLLTGCFRSITEFVRGSV